jgi:hypothetical protein
MGIAGHENELQSRESWTHAKDGTISNFFTAGHSYVSLPYGSPVGLPRDYDHIESIHEAFENIRLVINTPWEMTYNFISHTMVLKMLTPINEAAHCAFSEIFLLFRLGIGARKVVFCP